MLCRPLVAGDDEEVAHTPHVAILALEISKGNPCHYRMLRIS